MPVCECVCLCVCLYVLCAHSTITHFVRAYSKEASHHISYTSQLEEEKAIAGGFLEVNGWFVFPRDARQKINVSNLTGTRHTALCYMSTDK